MCILRIIFCATRNSLQPQQTAHRPCTRALAHGHHGRRRRRLGSLSLSPLATLCLNNRDRLLLSLYLNDRDLPVPLSTNVTCDATVETACRVLSCFTYPDVSRLVV